MAMMHGIEGEDSGFFVDCIAKHTIYVSIEIDGREFLIINVLMRKVRMN